VELLVVIGIIALLISILLPALSKARTAAMKVQCSSQLHSIGQAVQIFSQAHHGRVPDTQCVAWTNSTGGAWWPSWIYGPDFFELEKYLGGHPRASTSGAASGPTAGEREFICPFHLAKDPNADNLYSVFLGGTSNGWGAEPDCRAQSVTSNFRPLPAGVIPTDPEPGDNYFAQFVQTDYFCCGTNPCANNGGPSSYSHNRFEPQEVYFITDRANYGVGPVGSFGYLTLGLSKYNNNPPYLSDCIFMQNGVPSFNHGKQWRLDQSGNSVGDINVNVLFLDGHVDNKRPENTPCLPYGGGIYFYF